MNSAPKPQAPRPITGRFVAIGFILFFGVIMAVNFTMAWFAISGFGGTVVDNSYVASQRYNHWISAARAQAALGWQPVLSSDRDNHALVVIRDRQGPWTGRLSATATVVVGQDADHQIAFAALGNGVFRSLDPLPTGRHHVRLRLTSAERSARFLIDLP
jgi:nitrogen fixation protein FixH